jgi:hypothetical protein
MNKRITLLLFSLIAFNSNAVSLEKIAYCKEYSQLAEVIMQARQKGVDMTDLLTVLSGEEGGEYAVPLITSAYQHKRYSTNLDKQIIIDEFKVDAMSICILNLK